jgi:hypothetical protein
MVGSFFYRITLLVDGVWCVRPDPSVDLMAKRKFKTARSQFYFLWIPLSPLRGAAQPVKAHKRHIQFL